MLKGDKNKDGTYEKQPVIVQGITGKFGSVHTKLMLEYGTNIVAGVTPVSYTHLTLPTKA